MDRHDRFLAEHSILPLELIERPLVDEWLHALKQVLSNHYPELQFKPRTFTWLNTYDIDVAYAFAHRSRFRTVGSIIKKLLNGNFPAIKEQIRVLQGRETDPFDTYDFQESISRSLADRTIYFFLVGKPTAFDRNLPASSRGMKALVDRVKTFAEVGIHPSYYSEQRRTLLAESAMLRDLTKELVKYSRQHFLRVSLPNTMRWLDQGGIETDYSLGYADCIGFRSGTCTPHRFFDLEAKSVLNLTIVPLHAMDGTLRDYMKLNPSEASRALNELIGKVKAVEGTFVSLWHNDTLSPSRYPDWRQLYADMANMIYPK